MSWVTDSHRQNVMSLLQVLYSFLHTVTFLSMTVTAGRHLRDTSAAVIGEAGFTIKDPQRFATHFGRFILEENERFNTLPLRASPTLQQSPVRSQVASPVSLQAQRPSSAFLLQLALQSRDSRNPPIRFPAPESAGQFGGSEDVIAREEVRSRGRATVSEKLVITTPRNIFSRPNSQNRESFIQQFNSLPTSSPVRSRQLPNLQNPLLQTLFQSDNLQTGRSISSLSQAPRQGGDSEELQRELLDKQRQIDLLLDERKEKERLLIEALRRQSAERQYTGPSLTPTTSTTTTLTTTVTTTVTRSTTTATTARVEEFRSSDVIAEEEDEEEDEDYRVEFILEMTRGLVEATHKQRQNKSVEINEFSEDLLGKSFEEKPEKSSSPLEAIMNARDAVLRTMRSGNERTSPAIWAAVQILSDFVDSQQPGIPSDVLLAIIQLTEFLNAEDTRDGGDDDGGDGDGGDGTNGEDVPAPALFQPSRFTPPTTTEKQIVLSPQQTKLRDKLLKQKVMKQEEIERIIQRSKQKTKQSASGEFPGRIKLMDVSLNGQQFSFSTLPIY